ncbi:DUF4280 domain-containing protein [Lacrimispora sp.]|uniref:DUF4280 domain-containing protein n=1 Tax=Lacrimispora sp. TaxID=2719234 RepID=UPI0029E597AE|nr:hypothetical protein [Lacrimispora sp.]
MAELTDTYVVHGACTQCSMGMRQSRVVLHETHGVFLKKQAQMTVKDCKGEYHVICFGGCYSMENPSTQEEAKKVQDKVKELSPDTFLDKVMGFFTGGKKKKEKEEAAPAEGVPQVLGVCTPHIIAQEWDYGQDGVETDGDRPLMGGAKLYCIYGGEIEIIESGQPEAGSGVIPSSDNKKNSAEKMEALSDQFGFDEKSTKIMSDIYDKIQNKYKDLPQIEKDWFFSRAISQLGDYNSKPLNIIGLNIETHAWRKGAGWAYEYDKEKEYFCTDLGLKEGDYKYLRQMVRLQHFMSSDPENYSYEAVKTYADEKNDVFQSWKNTMENGIGTKLSDKEYLDLYKTLYDNTGDTGDYAHMMYTISANLNDSKYKVDNSWKNIGANALSWKNKDERKDITGWLGDAVYTGDNNSVSFGNDDYIADLDSVNIASRVLTGKSLIDSMDQYYKDLSISDPDEYRTKEFLSNNSYEEIEEEIFKRISIKDINNDGKKDLKDLETDITYSDTYDFLNKLKKYH